MNLRPVRISGSGASFWQDAMQCDQMWSNKHLRGIRTAVTPGPMRFGSAVHYAMAYHLLRQRDGADSHPPPLEATYEAIKRGMLEPMDADDNVRFPDVMWATWKTGCFTGGQVLYVEQRFELDCGTMQEVVVRSDGATEVNPSRLRALPQPGETILYAPTVDFVWESPEGLVYMVDHKTASRPSASTVNDYAKDLQFHGLAALGQAIYGDRLGGVLVHLIKTTPPFGVQKVRIPPAPAMVARFADRIWFKAHQLALLQVQGCPEDSYPAASSEKTGCRNKYRECDFWAEGTCPWGKK